MQDRPNEKSNQVRKDSMESNGKKNIIILGTIVHLDFFN